MIEEITEQMMDNLRVDSNLSFFETLVISCRVFEMDQSDIGGILFDP